MGQTLTRRECDGVLKDLALLVPRAGLGPDEIDRMLDLYFGLLRQEGVTQPMLARAAQAFIMAPKKGKPRFFPDPGELYELCADEAAARRRALSALEQALEALNDAADPKASPAERFVTREQLHELSEKLRVPESSGATLGASPREPARHVMPNTARQSTNVEELKAGLARLQQAKAAGAPVESLSRNQQQGRK